MHVTKIVKVGHGYFVNIRQAMADRLNLPKGAQVTVELTDKGILIKPLKINYKEVGDEIIKGR